MSAFRTSDWWSSAPRRSRRWDGAGARLGKRRRIGEESAREFRLGELWPTMEAEHREARAGVATRVAELESGAHGNRAGGRAAMGGLRQGASEQRG